MKVLATSLMIMLTQQLCAQPAPTSELVFTSVNVIPMDKEEVLPNRTVVIRDGKIVAVGGPSTKYSRNATVVEGKGKYLIPGLAEMHAHVPPNDNYDEQLEVLQLFALHGVTTIRGMLGHPSHLTLRDKLNNGEIVGPLLYTSGPSFSGGSVKTPEEGVRMVREQKQAGYDFLKIHPGLTPENFAAVARAADEAGIRFAGHIPFSIGVWKSIAAGYQTIDHLDGFVEGLVPGIENLTEKETGFFGVHVTRKADRNKIVELTRALREKGVWMVPTQALAERWMTSTRSAESLAQEPEMKYMSRSTLDNWVKGKSGMRNSNKYDSLEVVEYINLRRQLILACHQAGVGLLLGCDAPQVFNVPGVATHHELKYLVDAGLSPYEALRTGTVNVAKFYNREGDAGVVKKGADARLILLGANPLEDITNTRKIEGVVLGTTWWSKAYIEESLKKLEKQH